ncbi:MAG: hypothetical protein IKI87_09555, partial [Clostridiales bacterium]|nr:hypothetical protein [Clostridiales bacterium]
GGVCYVEMGIDQLAYYTPKRIIDTGGPPAYDEASHHKSEEIWNFALDPMYAENPDTGLEPVSPDKTEMTYRMTTGYMVFKDDGTEVPGYEFTLGFVEDIADEMERTGVSDYVVNMVRTEDDDPHSNRERAGLANELAPYLYIHYGMRTNSNEVEKRFIDIRVPATDTYVSAANRAYINTFLTYVTGYLEENGFRDASGDMETLLDDYCYYLVIPDDHVTGINWSAYPSLEIDIGGLYLGSVMTDEDSLYRELLIDAFTYAFDKFLTEETNQVRPDPSPNIVRAWEED